MERYDPTQYGHMGYTIHVSTVVLGIMECAIESHTILRGIECQRFVQCDLQLEPHHANDRQCCQLGQCDQYDPCMASGWWYQL